MCNDSRWKGQANLTAMKVHESILKNSQKFQPLFSYHVLEIVYLHEALLNGNLKKQMYS